MAVADPGVATVKLILAQDAAAAGLENASRRAVVWTAAAVVPVMAVADPDPGVETARLLLQVLVVENTAPALKIGSRPEMLTRMAPVMDAAAVDDDPGFATARLILMLQDAAAAAEVQTAAELQSATKMHGQTDRATVAAADFETLS